MADFVDVIKKDIMAEQMGMAMEMLTEALKVSGLDKEPATIAVLQEGLTPAQVLGLDREKLNVIYTLGYQKLLAGELDQAQDVFHYLMGIDPLHAPNMYMAGTVQLAKGNLPLARDLFLVFLAHDATNPDGYLRLGDCWLALGEREQAAEAFRLAEAECANGHGDELTAQEARLKRAIAKKEVLA